jgi:hypothetical protein
MIKRHDIRPRRKRGAAATGRPESGADAADTAEGPDVSDEGEEVGVD